MSTLSSVVAIGASVANLLSSDSPVIIGEVELEGFAIPESLPFGGKQALSVQGGERVINAMGWDPAPIQGKGIFLGSDALARALDLQQVAEQGDPISLTWDILSFTVLIDSFEPEYGLGGAYIPYRLSCTVLYDNTDQQAASSPSLLSQVGDDINSALGFNLTGTLSSAVSAVTPALTVAQTALGAVGALSKGGAAFTGAITALGSAQSIVSGALSSSGGILDTIAHTGTSLLGSASTALQGITNLTGAAAAAGDVANLANVAGYVGRTVTNMANASA